MTERAREAELKQEESPSRRLELIEEVLCPPEPQLLDTCVLQNLDWIDRQLESDGSVSWDDAAVTRLTQRYGTNLAKDLIDLGILYQQFQDRSAYPWLVSSRVQGEAALGGGAKRERVGSALQFFRGHQEDWSIDAYPGVAHGTLFRWRGAWVSPLLLRGLGVRSVGEICSLTGPLAFLPDEGDRLIAAEALITNIPAVLTTDRATFWRYRDELLTFGLTIIRPSELLPRYERYWEALDAELAQRSKTQA